MLKNGLKIKNIVFPIIPICIVLCALFIIVVYYLIKYTFYNNTEEYKNNEKSIYVCRLIGYVNLNSSDNILKKVSDIELYKAIDICKKNKRCKSFEFQINKLGNKKGTATFFSILEPIFIEHGEWNKNQFVSLYYKKNSKCTIANDIALDALNIANDVGFDALNLPYVDPLSVANHIINSKIEHDTKPLKSIFDKFKDKLDTDNRIINTFADASQTNFNTNEMKRKAKDKLKNKTFGSISNNTGDNAKIIQSSPILKVENNIPIKDMKSVDTDKIDNIINNDSNLLKNINDIPISKGFRRKKRKIKKFKSTF
jgi:hypothetical protein